MRPKNAGIHLEPLPEREREKKEGKKYARFVLHRKGLVRVLCVASTTFARITTKASRDGEGGGGPVFVVFVVFCCWTPVSRFSEGRSFSAFSLDVINYPPRLISCDSKEKIKRETKKTARRRRRTKKAFCCGRRRYGCGSRGDCRVRRRLPPRRSTNKKREIN